MTAHNETMSYMEFPAGTVVLSKGGAEWTVEKRRSRAVGVEHLLVSANGAKRWVDELGMVEGYAKKA